jgi:hypothetical protein
MSTTDNRTCICVARYGEDLNWLQSVKHPVQITVYNKGRPNYQTERHMAINLSNVGRESHTYLHHIIENYNNLPEYTIFMQGYPFDHSPNLYATLDRFFSTNDKPAAQHISEKLIVCNLSGCRHHRGLPLREVHNEVFGPGTTDKQFIFGAGAQFLVHKSLILKHSLSFYQRCIELVNKEVNPINGFVFERFWGLIFQ